MIWRAAAGVGACLLLGGCLASLVVTAVTLPIKAVGAGIDAVYTSQEEADAARGKRERKAEEKIRKQAEKDEKARRKAGGGA